MKTRSIILAAIILAAGACALQAQDTYFGKNKVQYKKFQWQYIQTKHFDIYFYEGGEYLANFTAAATESAYTMISKSFRYQINNRIPIMVYNSHNDFQQTNVVTEYLEEGIGGVTELFKNRVVIPFEGRYRQFRHVIHHELVHAVINDMFYGGSIQSIISNNIRLQLPLWFNEGLAEYESLKWDTNSDMFLRDATVHTYLPQIDYLSGYFAYRGGQSVWNYIANKYGEQKISEILNRIKGTRSVDQGFKSTLGLSVSELNERWQKEQKVMYWPDIAKREDPSDYATRITNHVKDGNFYNTSPAISPQGDKIAFISDRDDYFDVYTISTIDGKLTKIVDGQRTKNFEELHLLTPGMSWSPDGKSIALAAKSGERDALYLIDVATKDETKIEVDLEGVFSMSWSPDGSKIAFVGNRNRQSDIMVYDLHTKTMASLTDDIFSDSDPAWSPDGKMIYFSSDRRQYIQPAGLSSTFKMAHYDYSQLDIYSIDLDTRSIKRITDSPESDESNPMISPDGKSMLYVSDRSGIANVYLRNLFTGADRPITNSLTGVYQLSLSSDGNKLAFSALNEAGFDVFLMKTPFDRKLTTTEVEPTEFVKRSRKLMEQVVPTTGHLSADTAVVQPDTTRKASVQEDRKDTVSVYGENVRIDFRNFAFSEVPGVKPDSAESEEPVPVSENIDEEGNYKPIRYKLNFSPDIVYGNAAFSTFYGVQGTTMMAFSDMLGDHQIFFLTNLLLDLKNSDYVLAYYYLPLKVDLGIQGFHSARFLFLEDPYTGYAYLYRFRSWGLSGSALYPLDKYNRIDLGTTWLNLSRESMEYSYIPAQRRTLIVPSVSFVHDNSLWGFLSPNNGKRYNISVMVSPDLGSDGLDFKTLTGDHRSYFKFWGDYVFAMRFAGGISVGRNPMRFFIGGIDGWINREFEANGFPIENVEDYAFLSPVLPLRGYNYNIRNGNKYILMNYEMRYPLIRYLVTGAVPIALQNITGATFIDIGSAWSRNREYQGIGRDVEGNIVTKDLLIGTGFGARMILLGLPFKFDVAWSFNIDGFSVPKYYISLGTDY